MALMRSRLPPSPWPGSIPPPLLIFHGNFILFLRRVPLSEKLQVLHDLDPSLGRAVPQGSEGRVSSARPMTLKHLSIPEGRVGEKRTAAFRLGSLCEPVLVL